jgi:lysine 6-dehydrogenase
MRILVLGIGKQGSILIRDLIRSGDVSEVVAGDADMKAVQKMTRETSSEKFQGKKIDVTDHKKLLELMKEGFDVVASALPWRYNIDVAKAAIEAKVDYVDLGSPQVVFGLEKAAMAAGITIVPSCGLEPGIDSILQGYGAKKLDRVEKLHSWCGGIPQKDTSAYNNPLRYKISWSWEGAIATSCGTAKILLNGGIVEVEKLADPEIIRFPEPIGECEAFYTGAPLLLIEHLGLKGVKEAWSKTVRWPGHCKIWKELIALGLTRTDLRLRIRECEITPRDFLIELGKRTLQYKDGEEGDLVVLRVDVIGEKSGQKTAYSYELVDFYDQENDITAMARTTACPCSIVAQMIAHDDVKETGVIHVGRIGWKKRLAEMFFCELAERKIHIRETETHPLSMS